MLSYLIFRFFVFLFWLMPFWLFYRLCDFVAFLLYRVFKYRYEVIKMNLKNAFPEKSVEEIEVIIEKSYRNLADIILESIKGLSMSEEEICKRYKFLHLDLTNKYFEQGQSVFSAAVHCCNWEWGAVAFLLAVDHDMAGIYKPLKNKYIDQYIRKERAKQGLKLGALRETRILLDEIEASNKPHIIVFLGDQTPSNVKKADWVTFMNQDTACLQGIDRHARRMGYPVMFTYVRRVGRGDYEIIFDEIVKDPQTTKEGEITALFMAKLEEVLRNEPANWLWSHKRWKRKRSELEV